MDHWPNIISILQQELLSNTDEGFKKGQSGLVSQSYYGHFLAMYLKRPSSTPPSGMKTHVIQFYDQKVNATYTLSQIIPRVVVSVVHVGKHDEKRLWGATDTFVKELAKILVHGSALEMLRRSR